MAFKLRSPAFGPGGDIPVRHACDGSHVSPPLRWTDPPDGTKSFALAVADLDSTSVSVPLATLRNPRDAPRTP